MFCWEGDADALLDNHSLFTQNLQQKAQQLLTN